MIKAEAITHEGNPGPNWLDHCKNMITPGTVALVVIVASVLVGSLAIKNHRANNSTATANTQPAVHESQQAPLTPSQSLQVEPLNTTPVATSSPSTTQQSTATGQSSSSTPSTSPSSSSSSKSSASSSSTSSKSQGKGSSHASVNSAVNQTLQGVQQTLQQTVQETQNNLQNTLRGLGQ
jgi:hypothetical protein